MREGEEMKRKTRETGRKEIHLENRRVAILKFLRKPKRQKPV